MLTINSNKYDIRLSDNGHQYFVILKETEEIEKVFYSKDLAVSYVYDFEMKNIKLRKKKK